MGLEGDWASSRGGKDRPVLLRRVGPAGSWKIRWEIRGYGGAQGWDKTLVFDPDGKLKSYTYVHWPKD